MSIGSSNVPRSSLTPTFLVITYRHDNTPEICRRGNLVVFLILLLRRLFCVFMITNHIIIRQTSKVLGFCRIRLSTMLT